MFVEYIIPNPMTLKRRTENITISMAIPRSLFLLREFIDLLLPWHYWQLVWNPIAAWEQLFNLTVVTRLVTGFLRVWGSTVAACSVRMACTVSAAAMVAPLPLNMVTGRPIVV